MICRAGTIALALLAGAPAFGAPLDWRVFSYRPPAYSMVNGNSVVPVRGSRFGAGGSLTAGAQGGASLDGPDDATLSMIGPAGLRALAQNEGPSLSMDYGDYYLRVPRGRPQRVAFAGYDIVADDAEMFVEISSDGLTLKLHNLGPPIELDADTRIETGKSLFQSAEPGRVARIESTSSTADLERLRQRHYNNRHRYDLGRPAPPVPLAVDLAHVYVEGYVQVGWGHLTPAGNGATFVQNMPHVGPAARAVWARMLDAPEQPTRLDYLLRRQLRFGAVLQMPVTTIQAVRGGLDKQFFPGLGLVAGVGVGGFSLDVELGLQKAFSLSDRNYESSSPLLAAALLAYRWDWHSWTQADAGIVVGVRYAYVPMRARPDVAEATQPDAFTVHVISPIFGLSFMF